MISLREEIHSHNSQSLERIMSKSVFGSVLGKAAAAAVALSIVCGGLAFADDTTPTDPTAPPTTTVTPTPPPPATPDGHPWID